MRRSSGVGLLVLVGACAGGARQAGQLALQNARANAATNAASAPEVERRGAVVVRDDGAPTLHTVTGRGVPRSEVAPGTVVEWGRSTPSAGGYVVRSAGRGPGGVRSDGEGRAAVPPPPPPASPPVMVAPPTEAVVAARERADRDDAAPVVRGPARPATVHAQGLGSRATGLGGGGTGAALGLGDVAGHGRGVGRTADAVAAPRVRAEPRVMARPRPTRPGVGSGFGMGSAGITMHGSAAGMAAPAAPVGTRVTIAVMPPAPPPPAPREVVVVEEAQATAGLLTAASVGDVDRRENYLEYLTRHASEREALGLDMSRRVRVRVLDAANHPVLAARVRLSGSGLSFTALTHADGGFDFYPNVHASRFAGQASLDVEVESVTAHANVDVPATGDGQELTVRLPAVVAPPPPALDLAFAIDVTGSMGDELRYVNREVASIVQRITQEAPGTSVRVGATFYRDRNDDAVVQLIPFTTNVTGFASAMQGVTASGGGDYPEDMNAGLEAAMTRLNWSEGAAVRVLVVIADAPPQNYADAQFTYRTAITDAARRGIRLLPVGASGSNRTVEYLFRAMGASTSTPYVYLTDDSGVGGAHMEADTDRVAVERFNDLLTRMVGADLRGLGMHEPGPLGSPNS